ncbi:MAG: helix-turn-helix domain-containing protein [Clostridiales bacterium]|nr:helix-turn-helix domain-containing protein [Clostridiales bacterium]
MAKGKYQKWLEPDGLLLLEGWARDGLTDEQIAKNIGCSVRTLYGWKERYPQISQSLKKGKEVADYQVENALFKRATGYEATETRVEEYEGEIKTVTTTKPVPPDVTAQIFWLKNRRPDKWRDKPEPASSPDQEKAASKLFDALEKEEPE